MRHHVFKWAVEWICSLLCRKDHHSCLCGVPGLFVTKKHQKQGIRFQRSIWVRSTMYKRKLRKKIHNFRRLPLHPKERKRYKAPLRSKSHFPPMEICSRPGRFSLTLRKQSCRIVRKSCKKQSLFMNPKDRWNWICWQSRRLGETTPSSSGTNGVSRKVALASENLTILTSQMAWSWSDSQNKIIV